MASVKPIGTEDFPPTQKPAEQKPSTTTTTTTTDAPQAPSPDKKPSEA